MIKKIFIVMVVAASGIYFLTSTPAENQNANRVEANSWRHLALASKNDEDDDQLAKKINELGENGWELVDVESFLSAGETVKTVYYFKKPG
jgi:hypothetical protein